MYWCHLIRDEKPHIINPWYVYPGHGVAFNVHNGNPAWFWIDEKSVLNLQSVNCPANWMFEALRDWLDQFIFDMAEPS